MPKKCFSNFCRSMIFLALLSGCAAETNSSAPDNALEESAPSQSAPSQSAASAMGTGLVELKVASYDDVLAAVAEQKGKLVVLDLWSTSCLPCMQEFPHLVALSEKHRDEIVCFSVNLDYIGLKNKPADSYTPKVLKFLEQQQATLVRNYLSSTTDSEMFERFQIGSIPAVLVFDREGNLAATFTDSNAGDDGLSYQGDIVPKVSELLQQ